MYLYLRKVISANILPKILVENFEYSQVYPCLLFYGISLVYPKFDWRLGCRLPASVNDVKWVQLISFIFGQKAISLKKNLSRSP